MSGKDSYESVKQKALGQTFEYAEISDSTEAYIIIFDRDEKMGWREKIFTDNGEYKNMKIKIYGM